MRPLQTGFAAGEIDPRLIGRSDLGAYDEGALELRNVWVASGGGVKRRAGLRHVAAVAGPGRLAAVPLEDGAVRVFVLLDRRALVYEDERLVAALDAPWTVEHLPRLSWAGYRGDLFVCHPTLPPQHVVLEPYGHWRVLSWVFDTEPGADDAKVVRLQPYAKYANPEASLEAAPDGGELWALTSNQQVFGPDHVGTRLRFKTTEVALTSVAADGFTALGIPQTPIEDGARTFDWAEQAFGPVAGYPSACIVFRDRLVAGGVPRMPNRLWMSRIGRPFDFDTGTGLADEAIAIALGDDPAHAIRAFSTGRELEVFTTASEWTVDGRPLSPADVVAVKQTGLGCYEPRYVPPASVDGTSVFVARGGDAVVEYVFTRADTAYQAENLAVRARHLVAEPSDLAFDPARRLLLLVDGPGALATCTLDRNAAMVAWSRQETDGRVLAVAAAGGRAYLLVERDGTTRIEALADDHRLDAARSVGAEVPTTTWSDFDHLEGREVVVLADGAPPATATVTDGVVTTAAPARRVEAGLGFTGTIAPLPLLGEGRRPAQLFRPVQLTLQLHATRSLAVDLGEGLREVELAAADEPPFTGMKTLRARGWRGADDGPWWRVRLVEPADFHLLSVTSDVRIAR
ncbi:MAG: hypothetical protein GVY33_02720 [Alphaproteobacteria bacterium]|nr:hypothetical protein [Alphaproteobacteria bacterium]